jgi:hypothetical protein
MTPFPRIKNAFTPLASRFGLKLACALGVSFSLNLGGVENPLGADGNGAYATGRNRNLFADAGHSQVEIRQKIDSAFQPLFHGNLTNETVYYEAGSNSNGPLAFTTFYEFSMDIRTRHRVLC